MKKRIGLLIVCLVSVITANAQWSISPELGLSAYRRQFYEWRPGIKVGAAVEYQFKSPFSIESGLYYTQRGFSFTENADLPVHEEPSLVRHQFQIPIRARFAWKIADEVRLFAGVGPYLGLYFANDWKQTYLHQNDDYGKVAEIGLSIMGGVEVKRCFVRLGFEKSFGDEAYHAETLSFGYRF